MYKDGAYSTRVMEDTIKRNVKLAEKPAVKPGRDLS